MTAEERERLARAYLLIAGRLGHRDVTDLVWQYGPALAAELVAADSGETWETVAGSAVDTCRAHDLRLVVPGDDEWPALLTKYSWTAPLGLWVRGQGRLNELTGRTVAVAGTQAASPYGARVAAELARGFSRAGWTVVTLGRFGIDSVALRGALDAGQAAPMVLPLGRLIDTPAFHRALFRRLGHGGVLVSEHGTNHPDPSRRPDKRRQTHHLAALASAVVLVEPNGQGWDTRIAQVADTAGRPVLAVPGPVTAASFGFAHALIRTGRAQLVSGADDVLAALGGDR